MYEGFYNFTNTPFSRSIPSKSLYKGNDSDELIDRLKYTPLFGNELIFNAL